jgi:Papain family cysteine protease
MLVDVIVDLRAHFGPARDQKQRPTCMAFAASDAHAAVRGSVEPLSTEYAHYHAVRRTIPFEPRSGVSFDIMAQSIKEDGQPPEVVWPYTPLLPPNVEDWKPPESCSPIFRRAYRLEPSSIERVYGYLRDLRPVVIVMRISPGFYRPSPTGVIAAGPTELSTNSHAVVAVGFGKKGGSHLVLIRNSWGTNWGLLGHAWVAEEYLKSRMLTIGTADLEEV